MILNHLNLFRFSKFTIKNGKYLIPSKPTRPVSSFIKFNMQKSTGTTDVAERAKQNAEVWKTLSEQEKAKYKATPEQLQKYHKQLQDYEDKYLNPTKKVNLLSLVSKKAYEGKKLTSIQESSQLIKEAYATMTPEQKEKLLKEAHQKNEANQKKMEKYLIPTLQWDTFRKYKNHHKGDEATLLPKYQKYLENFEEQFKKFCEQHGIKPAILKRMITKENQEKLEQKDKKLQQSVSRKLKQVKKLDKEIQAKMGSIKAGEQTKTN